MARNLNIRLEEEIFDQLTKYCQTNKISKTEILKDYIQRLIKGEIQPLCNYGNDSVMLSPTEGLEEIIANHPKLKTLENKLENLIELVESKLCNDTVMQIDVSNSNENVEQYNDTTDKRNNIMTSNAIMTDDDKSLRNSPIEEEIVMSQDYIEGNIESSEDDKKSETEIGNKGLTDKELANLLTKQKKKVTSSTINRWRNGKSNPSGKNKNLFQEWRIERDRWFPKIE